MNNGWLKCSKVNKLELVIYEICLSSNYLDLAASFVFVENDKWVGITLLLTKTFDPIVATCTSSAFNYF